MLSYCASQVKETNRFNFQLCLFAPSTDQEALFSLFAFDAEVAKIPLVTSESITGLIRLQWWQDAIDEIYGGTPRKHPVVEALAETVKNNNLPKELFDLYLQHREWELEPEDKPSSVVLQDYFDQVFGGFHHLLLLALEPRASKELVGKARMLGANWGMVILLAQLRAADQSKDQKLVVIEGGEQLDGNFQILPDFVAGLLNDSQTSQLKFPRNLLSLSGRKLAIERGIKAMGQSSSVAMMTGIAELAGRGASLSLLRMRLFGG
ncbi:squalene/phytoene synthase family protein [Alphaproteobacteria bacterium]|nr:squalene/phytoene synthase family protein [Alphaproteobacteria bacterium]